MTDWEPLEPGQCALCGRQHPRHAVLTLAEFCERYRIARPTFYELKDKPVTFKVGNRIRIAMEDAMEWERKRKV